MRLHYMDGNGELLILHNPTRRQAKVAREVFGLTVISRDLYEKREQERMGQAPAEGK